MIHSAIVGDDGNRPAKINGQIAICSYMNIIYLSV